MLILFSSAALGATYDVCAACTYTSVKEAYDQVVLDGDTAGDATISVHAGTYTPTASLTVEHPLILVGAGEGLVTFDLSSLPNDETSWLYGSTGDPGGGPILALGNFTVLGKDNVRLLELSDASEAAVSDVTLINHDNNTDGGVFKVGSGALTLTRTTLDDIALTATKKGAVVHLGGSATLSVFDSQWSNLTGTEQGGAIWASGGSTVLLDGLDVDEVNGADRGGVIFVSGTTQLDVQGGTWALASTSGEGGAIWAGADTTVVIDGTTFQECSAKDGGAIEAFGALAIAGAAFLNNQANDTGTAEGGAVHCDGCVLNIDANSVFIGNEADDGGHLLLDNEADGSIAGSYTSGTAIQEGGAIYAAIDATHVLEIAAGTVFDDNSATLGGALYLALDTRVLGNAAGLAPIAFTANEAKSGAGGAIAAVGADLELINAIFSGNAALADSGGAFSGKDGPGEGSTPRGHFECLDCTFSDNEAATEGGHVFLDNDYKATLTDCSFNGTNGADGTPLVRDHDGGALSAISSVVVLDGTSFMGFQVEETASIMVLRSGGAVSVETSSLTVTGGAFLDNDAEGDGGAVFASSSDVTVDGTGFRRNTAGVDGGAISLYRDQDDFTFEIQDATFLTNSASLRGGAVWTNFGGPALTPSSLVGNIFQSNGATTSGGAVAFTDLTSPAELVRNVFCGNTAGINGAGLFFEDTGLHESTAHGVRNNVFAGNIATGDGGGLFSHDPVALANNHFLDNVASTGGGAHIEGDTTTIQHNLFYANDGSGLSLSFNVAPLLFSNNHWDGNTPTPYTGSAGVPTPSANMGDPQLSDYTGTCGDDTYTPVWGSPLVDVGPTNTDPDGSLTDVGAYGGPDADPDQFVDEDSDTYVVMFDCNDAFGSGEDINPGATEVCDGDDNDCDELIDDNDPSVDDQTLWYIDADEDDFGDENDAPDLLCEAPPDHVDNNLDCNDDPNAGGAQQTPNTLWYDDLDGDGFGDEDDPGTKACEAPTDNKHVLDHTDCDDDNAAVNDTSMWYADADEDGFGDEDDAGTKACEAPTDTHVLDDNSDCDDDNALINDESVWYDDLDDDGFGADSDPGDQQCTAPAGNDHVLVAGDCNDQDAAIHPESVWLDDADNDGYGDWSDEGAVACEAPTDIPHVLTGGDCNDQNSDINPDSIWYDDADGDGFGDVNDSGTNSCEAPTDLAHSLIAGDCDDTNAQATPDAIWYDDADEDGYGDDDDDGAAQCEPPPGVQSRIDGDCDDTDAEVNPDSVWYDDVDGDGYGNAADEGDVGCEPPLGVHVLDNTDCNDTVNGAGIHPDADESCDGIDNDCDGLIDEADPDLLSGQLTLFYPDDDRDGAGDDSASGIEACFPETGQVADNSDCDDEDANTYGGAPELCDGIDNDCNGAVETQSEITYVDWFLDTDGDGYGSGSAQNDCSPPGEGYVQLDGDCDEGDDEVSPAAIELCDGIDNDCSGAVDDSPDDGDRYFLDADDDGYGDPMLTNSVVACSELVGYSLNDFDCDDNDGDVNPDGLESCNGIDDDCNGDIDDDALDATPFYGDADDDGFGNASDVTQACTPPAGHVSDATDCDDSRDDVYPGAPELCDGLDNDCNLQVDTNVADHYPDADEDGFGDAAATPSSDCDSIGAGWVADASDCDDSSDSVNPDAEETWYDGVDQDCDLANDYDQDGDGYVAEAFDDQAGALLPGDCDDVDAAINPGAGNCGEPGTDRVPDPSSPNEWSDSLDDSLSGGAMGCSCDQRGGAGGAMPLFGVLLMFAIGRRRSMLRKPPESECLSSG